MYDLLAPRYYHIVLKRKLLINFSMIWRDFHKTEFKGTKMLICGNRIGPFLPAKGLYDTTTRKHGHCESQIAMKNDKYITNSKVKFYIKAEKWS